jgi:hypothetical protein
MVKWDVVVASSQREEGTGVFAVILRGDGVVVPTIRVSSFGAG